MNIICLVINVSSFRYDLNSFVNLYMLGFSINFIRLFFSVSGICAWRLRYMMRVAAWVHASQVFVHWSDAHIVKFGGEIKNYCKSNKPCSRWTNFSVIQIRFSWGLEGSLYSIRVKFVLMYLVHRFVELLRAIRWVLVKVKASAWRPFVLVGCLPSIFLSYSIALFIDYALVIFKSMICLWFKFQVLFMFWWIRMCGLVLKNTFLWFELFIYILFKFKMFRMRNLDIIFKFLGVSVGSTCSALPVNSKDVWSCVYFRRKLLFCWCAFRHYLLSISTDSCVYLVLGMKWLRHAYE